MFKPYEKAPEPTQPAADFADFDIAIPKRTAKRERKPTLELTAVKGREKTWKKKINGKTVLFHGSLEVAQTQLIKYLSQIVDPDDTSDITLTDKKYLGERITKPETIANYTDLFLAYNLKRVAKDEIAKATFIELKTAITFLKSKVNCDQPIKKLDWNFIKAYKTVIDAHPVTEVRKRNLAKQFIQFVRWLPTEIESYQIPSNIIGLKFIPKIKSQTERDEQFIFTPKEFQAALKNASPKFKAILLLGLNCGFTSDDFTFLRSSDIKGNRLIHQREKLKRRGGPIVNFKLWQETIDALKAIEQPDGTYFVGKTTRVDLTTGTFSKFDAISRRWRQLVKLGKMPNKQLKGLRKTGAVVVDEFSRDKNLHLLYLADMVPGTGKNYIVRPGNIQDNLDKATDYLRDKFLA